MKKAFHLHKHGLHIKVASLNLQKQISFYLD